MPQLCPQAFLNNVVSVVVRLISVNFFGFFLLIGFYCFKLHFICYVQQSDLVALKSGERLFTWHHPYQVNFVMGCLMEIIFLSTTLLLGKAKEVNLNHYAVQDPFLISHIAEV